MPCKIQIKKELTNKVDELSKDGLGKSLVKAKEVANKVNNQFGAKVVEFNKSGDFIDRSITIPNSLVDIYYNEELVIEQREDNLQKEKDNLQRQKQGNWQVDEEGNIIPFSPEFESRVKKQEFEDCKKAWNKN